MASESPFHKGDILYRIIGYTSKAYESLYKGYPIYGLFEVMDEIKAKQQATNPFGDGWRRVGNAFIPPMYWNPWTEYNKEFILYNTGDETTQQYFYDWRNSKVTEKDPANYSSQLNSPVSVAAYKSPGVNAGLTKLWLGEIYKATSQSIQWSEIVKYNINAAPTVKNVNTANPYQGNVITVWVKVSGLNPSEETGSTYWWDPRDNVFRLVNPSINYLIGNVGTSVEDSLREGKILSLIAQGKTRAQAEAELDAIDKTTTETSQDGSSATPPANKTTTPSGTAKKNTSVPGKNTGTAPGVPAKITATVRVRGNFGFVEPGEPEGSGAQMVQYFKDSSGQIVEPARHIFSPKPNQINYQNLGSEWTEIERSGRIPLVDWKNYRLMRVSFQFLVLPDSTYRTGAFGDTADDGITLSIDNKLETLRNMASRPYPVILYGFDELLINANPFSFSTGAGVQFAISDFSISSLIRTPTGAINRAQCDITLQEVPIEYINVISLPKLVPGQVIKPPKPGDPEIDYGKQDLFVDRIG